MLVHDQLDAAKSARARRPAETERGSLREEDEVTQDNDTPLHNFTFILGPEEQLTDDTIDQILAVCDDALVGGRDQMAMVEFDREAPRFAQAVVAALQEIEQVPGVRVLRIEPEELVGLSAIAARLDRSVESIRLLAAGERGPGGFPAPAARVDAKTRLWEWTAVTQWWHDHMDPTTADLLSDASFLASLNDALDLRARAPRLDAAELEAVAGIVREAALA